MEITYVNPEGIVISAVVLLAVISCALLYYSWIRRRGAAGRFDAFYDGPYFGMNKSTYKWNKIGCQLDLGTSDLRVSFSGAFSDQKDICLKYSEITQYGLEPNATNTIFVVYNEEIYRFIGMWPGSFLKRMGEQIGPK